MEINQLQLQWRCYQKSFLHKSNIDQNISLSKNWHEVHKAISLNSLSQEIVYIHYLESANYKSFIHLLEGSLNVLTQLEQLHYPSFGFLGLLALNVRKWLIWIIRIKRSINTGHANGCFSQVLHQRKLIDNYSDLTDKLFSLLHHMILILHSTFKNFFHSKTFPSHAND